tara:strand:+ start:7703 stop:9376 length:1674 start_codon:yes stop_codon:yes gene_type:complete
MKSLNEEQKRMRELMGFTYEDNSHNILSEEFINKSLNEQKKTKGGGFSLGKSDINIFGRTGGHVDFNWEIDPLKVNIDWDKEAGVALESEDDLLNKMNQELGKKEGYGNLTADQKRKVAIGFFNGIKKIVKDNLKGVVDKKQRRNFKKFFKKSNRWEFDIVDVKLEGCKSAAACRKEKLSLLDEIKLQYTQYEAPDIPKNDGAQIASNTKQQLDSIIDNNTSLDAVIKSKPSQIIDQNPLITSNNLMPFKIDDIPTEDAGDLEVVFAYQKQKIKYKKISDDKQSVITIDLDDLTTGKLPIDFAAMKHEIKSGDAQKVRQAIIDVIRKVPVTLPESSKSENKNTTIGEIVDLGNGFVNISTINLIGAASNAWGGKLEATHDISGNKLPGGRSVNDIFKDPKSKEGDKLNIELGRKRLNSMRNLIVPFIQKTSWLKPSKQTRIVPELKIIDTGGVPNRKGQYTEVILDGTLQIQETKFQRGTGSLTGKFGGQKIILDFKGKPKRDFDINIGGGMRFNKTSSPSKNSRYFKKKLFGKGLKQRTTKHGMKKRWFDGSRFGT